MALFEKKREISRGEFREKLRKASPVIPGGGGMFSELERVKMEKEIFGEKYGSHISNEDYTKALREMETAQNGAKTDTEKIQIERKIRFLKELKEV